LNGDIWITRYLLFIAPYLLILLAETACFLWASIRPLAFVFFASYALAVVIGLSHYYGILYREDWQGVAADLPQNLDGQSAIVYYAPEHYVDYSLPRYYTSPQALTVVSATENEFNPEQLLPSMVPEFGTDISRLYLVCYISCRDEQGIELIADEALGSRHSIVTEKSFKGKAPGSVWPMKLLVIE
jgi:hypothetical protein